MKLRTEIEFPTYPLTIGHRTPIMLAGSCFSVNIGARLRRAKFDLIRSPCGISYNPLSMHQMLQRLADGRPFERSDLTIIDGSPYPFFHHGSFRKDTVEQTQKEIDHAWTEAMQRFSDLGMLVLTWGTAFVWEREGVIVNNCHKRPHSEFNHRILSVEEIIKPYEELLSHLSTCHILLNVSPIRHLHAGLVQNNLSKSILHLAAHTLCQRFSHVHYFPSYEMLIDDLRDYRFYASDLLHPSELAVDYIWSGFQTAFFSPKTRTVIGEFDKLQKRLRHRAIDPHSISYQRFIQQNQNLLSRAKQQYPHADWTEEDTLLAMQERAM
ncbi:MAG: GSCFA domain-containing protein [Myxococcota bacterium]|nr:GSCFA domain-containing protein [Myxococcota bacterium]